VKPREIDQIVRRYSEGPSQWSSREASSEASQMASVALAR
jgi:hypothetical protein